MPQNSHIYPLLAKPGIIRDGTSFQEDYWTDGQWVRFQRGFPRTIGGYESLISAVVATPGKIDALYSFNMSNDNYVFFIRRSHNNQTPDKLICLKKGETFINIDFSNIYKNNDYLNTNNASFSFYGPIYKTPKNPNGVGGANTKDHFIMSITYDDKEILSESRSQLFLIPLFKNIFTENTYQGLLNAYKIDLTKIVDPNTREGGNCNSSFGYIENRLFVGGLNGLIAWSDSDLENFNPIKKVDDKEEDTGAGRRNCGSSKILHFISIRGGAQSPTLLVWTQSSLLRLLNVDETESENEEDKTIEIFKFKQETISDDISLMSKKSIVSYDGIIYWIGNDRFYVYNGTCQEIPNNLNKNFFFENIHPDMYNQVCGTINPRFGEIWWFYSHKGFPGAGVRNNRVLIYNKLENTWFDSQINRDSCCYDHHDGKMLAAGQDISEDKTYVWTHDVGTDQKINNNSTPIESSITSPIVSWASISPSKQHVGVNSQIELEHIEPSFRFDDKDKNSIIKVKVITRKYPSSNPIPSNEKEIKETPVTEKLEIKVKSRFIQLEFQSNFPWEMGKCLCLFKTEGEN